MDLVSVRRLLRRSSFFQELSPLQFQKTTGLLKRQTFKDGEAVITQGDYGDRFYLLLEGEAKAFVRQASGTEKEVMDYTTPGSFFGELALLQNTPRRATVRVVGKTTLLSLSRKDFEATLGPLRELLLRNAAVRPADSALRWVREFENMNPTDELFGLRREQRQTLLGVCFYLLVGTAFYTWSGFEELEHTTPAAGFYYSVVVGLAVGFGKLTPVSAAAPFFTCAFVLGGALLLADALSIAFADIVEGAEQESTSVVADRQSLQKSYVRCLGPLTVWWSLGVAFGRVHEGWDWGTAGLFAMSATSSVGIQGLRSSDDASFLFCALYTLVGVPLYGTALGRFSLLIAAAILERRRMEIRERVGRLVREECDEECIVDLFSVFDQNQDQLIDKEEMPELWRFLSMAQNTDLTEDDISFLLEEFDKDGNGVIDREEFVSCLGNWASQVESRVGATGVPGGQAVVRDLPDRAHT